jgi:hypothetical protein
MMFLIPYIIVKISKDEQEILRLFSWHILIIIPVFVIGSKWYIRILKGESSREILKSFISAPQTLKKLKMFFSRKK